jgi:hypothetical protein
MSKENADKSKNTDKPVARDQDSKRQPKKYPPPSPESHSQDADRHRKIKHPVSDK